ncbi:hypothetical protein [Rheinheimera fenheensis]|uniref:hypothetical protein n=2 Tax=Rheinheimera fenheensis TaxID=3152295 RepID=UPI00325D7D67
MALYLLMNHFNFSASEHQKAGWLLVLFACCYFFALLAGSQSSGNINSSDGPGNSCIELSGSEQLECYRVENNLPQLYSDTVSFRKELIFLGQLFFVVQLLMLTAFKINWLQALLVFGFNGAIVLFTSVGLWLFALLVPLICFSLVRNYWHLRAWFW